MFILFLFVYYYYRLSFLFLYKEEEEDEVVRNGIREQLVAIDCRHIPECDTVLAAKYVVLTYHRNLLSNVRADDPMLRLYHLT